MAELTQEMKMDVGVSEDAAGLEPVAFAAQELRSYLGRILDVEVGHAGKADQATFVLQIKPSEALGDEGYEIAAQNGQVVVTGGSPLGVLFGVYYFLERFGGCRFSGLGPDGEYVPRQKRVSLPDQPVQRKPELWYRSLQFFYSEPKALMVQRVDWMAKNGMNYVLVRPDPDDRDIGHGPSVDPETGELREDKLEILYCQTWYRRHLLPEIRKRGMKVDVNHHNLFTWLPPHRHFDDHPEWYPLVNGQRTAAPHQLSICTSNREAVNTLIDNMKAYLRENPETDIIGLIPEDGNGWCLCEDCRQLDPSPRDALRTPADSKTPEAENQAKVRRYALLLNEVAAALKTEFPHVKLGAAAYTDLIHAPKTVELDPVIVPWIATYWRCSAHRLTDPGCPTNPYFHDVVRDWRERHKGRVTLYAYYMGMFAQGSIPFPIHDTICRDWDDLKQMGIDGANVQSTSDNHHVYGMNYLAFARCGWESGVSPDRVRDDFLLGMFGAAASAVRPIFDTLKKRMGTNGPHSVLGLNDCLRPDASNILQLDPEKDFDRFRSCIATGLAAADSDAETRNLERLQQAVQYWELSWFVEDYRVSREAAEREAGRKALEAYRRVRASHEQDLLPDPNDAWMVGRVHLADARTEETLLRDCAFKFLRRGEALGLDLAAARPLRVALRLDQGEPREITVEPGKPCKLMAKSRLVVNIPDMSDVSLLAFNGIKCHTPYRAVRVTAETDRAGGFKPGNPYLRWTFEKLCG